MPSEIPEARTFELFAALLDYPGGGLVAAAEECAARVVERSPDAAPALLGFADFARRTSRTRLEEIYTGLFELDASHHPYVGYHLFGESYQRSEFLLGLKARYRPHDIDCGVELPDHLAAVLRFLAVDDDPVEARELVEDALGPALAKMLKRPNGEAPPEPGIPEPVAPGQEYRGVLHSLWLWLRALGPEDELGPEASSGETRTGSACA